MRQPIWSWFVFVFLFVFPTLIVGSGEITFPSAYSICVPGFACTVTWASTVNVGNIKLDVYRDDWGSDPLIATVTSSSTSKTLTWTPPASIGMSDQYYYYGASTLNAALNGESGKFTIRPVDVWTNVDGSSVNMGSSFTVGIEAITIGTTSYSSNIKIAIYQDVLLTDPIILSTVTIPRTTTSYVWTVPENLSTTDINNCYVRITHTYGGTESSIDNSGRFNIKAPARTLTASLISDVCIPGYPCTVNWSASATAAVGGITVELYRYRALFPTNEFITILSSANTGTSFSWTPLAGTYKTGERYYFELSGNGITHKTVNFELRGLQIKTPTVGSSYNLGDSFNVTWISSPALANTLLPIRMFRSDDWALDAAFGVFYAYGRDGTIKLNIPRNMASTTAQYYAEITYTTDGTQYKQESPLFTVRGPTTSLYPSCSSCQCPSGGLLFADTCQCSIAQTCTPVVGGSTSSPTTTSISSVPADTCCRGSSACSGASATQTINSVMFCCPQGGSMTYDGDCNCGGRAQLCNGPLPTAAPTTAPAPQATATPTGTTSPIGTNGASNGNSNGGNINNNISQSSSSSSTLPIAIGAAVGGLVLLAAIIGGIWWRSRRGNKVFVTETAAGPQKIQTMPRQSIQPIQVPPHYQKQIDDSMAKSPV